MDDRWVAKMRPRKPRKVWKIDNSFPSNRTDLDWGIDEEREIVGYYTEKYAHVNLAITE